MKLTHIFISLALFFCHCAHSQSDIWKDVKKFPLPEYRMQKTEGAAEIYFEGEKLGGKPTEVFAYYCTPGILEGNPQLDENLPAVVCVHGGGGRAYKEWAQNWARRGYAAIALDWRGQGPDAKRMTNGGPEQTYPNIVTTPEQPFAETWTYHAVSAIARAHTIIRSFTEVDAEKTAITGVSWGGFLTCISVGVDARYKAAVPVYGCGFLQDCEVWSKATVKESNPAHYKFWIEEADPSVQLATTAVPMMFINGTNDPWYPLPMWTKSLRLVKDRNQKIIPCLGHSHGHAWKVEEVYAFIGSKIKGGKPLPKLSDMELSGGGARAKVEGGAKPVRASFHYTEDFHPLWKDRVWKEIPAQMRNGTLSVERVPESASAFFFSVEDVHGLGASSAPHIIR